jgi:choline monooxygenase
MRTLIDQFDSTLPLDRAHTIPAAWYFDADLYQRERQTVFAGWQAVARFDQLREPGSFATIEVAGEPIVVLRDETGVLRAFYNVCRHRAAVVVPESCGKIDKLRCRYHGWTYDLQGRLKGLPEFEGVCDFPKDRNGLVPLTVATWGPTVWAHTEPARKSFGEFFGPFEKLCGHLELDQLQFAGRREYDIDCNWKVYVDNYLDGGYHINTVHPGLAGVLDYSQYRTEMFDECSVQISPLVPSGDRATDAVRKGDKAYYWWFFPNFMINVYEGVMDTNLVLPLGSDRCRVIFDFYFANADPEFARQSIDVADKVQDEDMTICAEVQRGLHSRTYNTGRYSVKREGAVYHFHRLLHHYLSNPKPCP